MKIRHRLGLAVALALTLATTACGVGGSATAPQAEPTAVVPELTPDQQVSIIFESYNFGQAGAWTDTFTALIDQFQAEHPNITVTPQRPQGNSPNPATDTISSLQTQIAAGNPPDVAQLGFSDLDFTVNQLGAKPLDTIVGTEAVQANFDGAEHPYAPTARVLGDWEGQTYGVPFVFSTPVLYYNASLFEAAGLDPAAPPTTWAEVGTAAQAITAATGKGGVYLDCLTKTAKDWCLQALVRSNGGRVISEDRTAPTFADPEVVEVVEMARGFVDAGVTPVFTQQQGYEAFARGEMGMILETSAIQATFTKGAASGGWDLRSAPMPSFDGQPTIPTNSGASLFLLADDPAKQRAGWELMQFLTSENAYEMISTNIGYLPLRTGLVDDPDGLQGWIAENPLVRPNLEQLGRMEPWISFPGNSYLQIRDGMMEAVEASVYQGADPATTLADAQERAVGLFPGDG
ncbi:ABC transporter substrate-binding protein [Pseudonocardia abyssalis]|uniref:ABC transporter substrate-binding protein n=1 Tax=Pseudonocardia abyssalis TaxID=2792008 RepID=A0ABS6UNX2_9PSEU|nr:ABC transporter substrate-binding protein [Pseudonocardia abyssalis]MBW0116043.1 ABC transporter substrate-binding protein [Pseudonocardia abyssalis]MBW0133877.1 ABC transporter substrate-binding protein [Pseudonocardia abyssalis]